MGNELRASESVANVSSDQAALEALGKKQVLKREWNFVAILGMSTATLATWEATSALFAAAYLNGGPASVVYGFIVSACGILAIGASLAELAAISPIAGAQYHWTAEHAPLRFRAFLSWMEGWITLLGWQSAVASVAFITSSLIQGLVKFNVPEYEAQRWHATLMMICLAGLACLVNTIGKKLLPIWETLTGILHVLFFFIITISVLAISDKAPSKDVWNTLINTSGWPSDGISFCLGFLTPAFAFAGVETVVHMAEETHSANKTIPQAMIYTVVVNGISGFVYIVVILYAITDPTRVLETETGFPIIEVFFQVTNNKRAATAMTCSLIIIFSMAFLGIVTSTSRLTWAFARDHGLPFSDFLSHVSPSNRCPTRAVVVCFMVTCLLSLINIGSTTAFNALTTLATMGIYFSYMVPIVLFAIRRFSRTNPIQFGPFSLGRYGLVINIFAAIFCVFLVIFLPFPTILPVTGLNMNYSSPVFLGVIGFAIAFWFLGGKKRFTGPIKETETVSF